MPRLIGEGHVGDGWNDVGGRVGDGWKGERQIGGDGNGGMGAK